MQVPEAIITSLASMHTSDRAIFLLLCRHYANAVSERILNAPTGRASTWPSIESALEINAQAGLRCWSPELGFANALSRRGELSQAAAAAQLCLHLAGVGLRGTYEFELSYPERLLLQNRWFRCRDTIRVTSSAETVEVASGGETCEVSRSEAAEGSSSSLRCPGHSLSFVWGYGVDPEILEWGDIALAGGDVAKACAGGKECLDFLASTSPRGYSWVEQALRQMSFTASNGGERLSSRSNPTRPGDIQISMPGDLLHVAELAVHESAHQHYHLGSFLGPFVREASPGQLFYSALADRYRPLNRVALAFHAVGSILALMSDVVAGGGTQAAAAADRIRELDPTARSLIATLEDNAEQLTDAGRLLLCDLIKSTKSRLADHCEDRPKALAV